MILIIDNDLAPAELQSCIPDMLDGLAGSLGPKSTFALLDESAIEAAATMRYMMASTIPCNNRDSQPILVMKNGDHTIRLTIARPAIHTGGPHIKLQTPPAPPHH